METIVTLTTPTGIRIRILIDDETSPLRTSLRTALLMNIGYIGSGDPDGIIIDATRTDLAQFLTEALRDSAPPKIIFQTSEREFSWEVTKGRQVLACGYATGLESACTFCRAKYEELLDLSGESASALRGTVSEANEEIWTTDDDEE